MALMELTKPHYDVDEEKIKGGETQAERDAERLRTLGYDAVLGRPLGFWGNMFLSLTCMNPMFDVVVSTTIWAYQGPELFVSTSRSGTDPSSTATPSRSSCTSS